jgi:hypothetical protein
MKPGNIKFSFCSLMAAVLMFTTACKKDYTDQSRASQEQVIKSATGLTGVAVGVQRDYTTTRAGSIYNLVTADGFLANVLNIINQGNTAEYQLYQGGDKVDLNNSLILSFWTNSNKVIYDANNVLIYAPDLADKNYASGLIAYASIFKALALGNLAMFWDHVPDTTGSNVSFISSADAFNKAVAVLDNALATVNANAISSSFLSNIPAGIDIVNTLHALKARYSLFAGNYAQALTEANAVNLSAKSTFNFDLVNLNPIFETATSTNNVYQPIDSTMGLPPSLAPDLSDKREPFYLALNTAVTRFKLNGFWATSTQAIPVYLPGEMTLIKAEAYTRQNDFPDAVIQLNAILTKKPANDPFGVGADLPPYAGAVTQSALLDQIYRNRSIELYLSGLKLEDMRRFNRPTSERKRSFLPYPFAERTNNTNTPDDPTF